MPALSLRVAILLYLIPLPPYSLLFLYNTKYFSTRFDNLKQQDITPKRFWLQCACFGAKVKRSAPSAKFSPSS